jgi:glycosidase
LKIADNYPEINVARENENLGSILNCYRRLLALRRENAALRSGLFELIDAGGLKRKCLAYRRTTGQQNLFVYLNFCENILKIRCPVESPELLFSTRTDRASLSAETPDTDFRLYPYEGVVFKNQYTPGPITL